jgi:DNA-binding NarL/FixJ family response regulator
MQSESVAAKRTSITIVDDCQFLGEALSGALNSAEGLNVLALVNTCEAALTLIARQPVDVLLLGSELPAADVMWIARKLSHAHAGTRLVSVVAGPDHPAVDDYIEAGIDAFVLKHQGLSELIDAVRTAARGDAFLPPPLIAHAMRRIKQSRNPNGYLGAHLITRREREILVCLSHGYSVDDIAAACHISPFALISAICLPSCRFIRGWRPSALRTTTGCLACQRLQTRSLPLLCQADT